MSLRVWSPEAGFPRRFTAGVVLAACWCCASGAENGTVGSEPAAEPVLRLIELLGDPQRARREAATEQLEGLGVRILPLLERSASAGDRGEKGWRLRMLRTRLEAAAIAEAVEPTLVAASPGATPLSEALASLFESPGGRLGLAQDMAEGGFVGEASPPAMATLTYWEELGRLLTAADAQLAPDESDGRLQIRRRGADEPRPVAAAAGPLRIDLLRAVAVPPEQPRAIRLAVRVAWEPRLQPVMLQLPMRSLVAEGDAGEVVPPRQRMAVVEASRRGSRNWVSMSLLLDAPPASLDRLAIVRGTLQVWVPAGDVEIRFPLQETAQQPRERRFGEAVVRLESASIDEQTITVLLRADYPASEALASHRTWLANRRLTCHLGDDERPVVSERVVRRDDRGITLQAVFQLPAGSDPAVTRGEVRWRLPLAIREVPIDFLLSGIPLPYASDAKNAAPQ